MEGPGDSAARPWPWHAAGAAPVSLAGRQGADEDEDAACGEQRLRDDDPDHGLTSSRVSTVGACVRPSCGGGSGGS